MTHSSTQTTSERVDDLPLILHWLKQMEVAEQIDQQLKPVHGNRKGLSYGQLSVLLLAYVVSQSDHRFNHVEGWVRVHRRTLEQASGWTIDDKDASDDRLADLVSAIGSSPQLAALEEMMAQQVVRAYELPTEIARCDSSSFSVYHQAQAQGNSEALIQYGYSKDHRPDLRQYRHALATLDPAGIPLLSATLAGNGDDDSIYYPFWNRLVAVIGHRHFVYIADAKAASYQTRAQLNQAGGVYCFPLPMTGQIPERLQQWVTSPPAQLQSIALPHQSSEEPPACWGFELSLGNLWPNPDTQQVYGWSERYLVIRSEALAQRQRQGLDQRLEKTQQALDKLSLKAAKDCCVLKNQVQSVLKRYRTEDYFITDVQTQLVIQQVGRGRPSTKHPKPQKTIEQFHLQVQRQSEAIEQAYALCGWRLYVTNATPQQFSLADALIYYREQWQLERGFHRFKRGQLPALPMFLQDQQRIVGLMFLLTVALRLFTLMEFVVHQQLQTLHQSLDGLYAGNPKRKTERPSTEQILSAFREITLYFFKDGTVEISPLTSLQQRILALMRVPLSIYQLPDPVQ